MSFIYSPNMSLNIPTVGQEPGPQYAFDVNTSLTLIDQHDHSPGRGVQINPAGMNINALLDMQNNTLNNVMNVVFDAQGSNSSLQSLYVAPGTEGPPINDLFFNDGAGNVIQLTSNGTVNASIASLPGESYAAGTFFWKQGTGSTTPANFDIGSITIRPNIALTSNGVVLGPNAGIASQYNIQLPLPTLTTNIMTLDSAGNMAAVTNVDNTTLQLSSNTLSIKNGGITSAQISSTAGITGSQIAALTITGSNIAALAITGANIANGTITPAKLSTNYQTATINASRSTVGDTDTDIGVAQSYSGRPVILSCYAGTFNTAAAVSARLILTRFDGSTNTVLQTFVQMNPGQTNNFGFVLLTSVVQSSSGPIAIIDTPAAGTYTYRCRLETFNASGTATLTNVKFLLYEL